MFPTFLILMFTALSVLYVYYKHVYGFWKRKGVPQLKPMAPFGDFLPVLTVQQSMGERLEDIYKAFKGERYGGLYQLSRPVLMIRDPELIKGLLVKQFANYNSHGFFVDEKQDPLSGHLFSLSGSRWKFMRAKLSPTFTSGKMKYMFGIMENLANELQSYLKDTIKEDPVLDIREVTARFSTDVIASVAFGIEANSLRNPDAEFRKMGRKIFEPSIGLLARNFCLVSAHWIMKFFGMTIIHPEAQQFILNMVRLTVKYRVMNSVQRDDFLQLLIKLMEKEEGNDGESGRALTLDEVAAQTFLFFVAGFETTSSTISFSLLEMARHPDVQEKVRAEIDAELSKCGGKPSYNMLQNLTYTDTVIYETLRLYPPLPMLFREVIKPTELGDTGLVLEAGQQISIPILAMHRDPTIFRDPLEFKPERFADKDAIKPYTYMPFGEGPRICIGMRFAMMQIKLTLVRMLADYKVHLTEAAPKVVELDPRSLIMMPKQSLLLRFQPRAKAA